MNELVSTGNYDQKAIEKFINKQINGAKKFGANDTQAKSQAEALLRVYKHNFLIRKAVSC